MKSLALLLLVSCSCCWAQRSTNANNQTTGPCSPISSGSNNNFTIRCGIGKKEGEKMLAILNTILAKQLDPNAVMEKLDEIQKGIRGITKHQWPELTNQQIQDLCRAIGPPVGIPAGAALSIIVPNQDENRLLLAHQLVEAFKCAKWENVYADNMIVFPAPGSETPFGIELLAEQETPIVDRVGYALVGTFGKNAIKPILTKGAWLQISIWYRPD